MHARRKRNIDSHSFVKRVNSKITTSFTDSHQIITALLTDHTVLCELVDYM